MITKTGVLLEITADDPTTIQTDLNTAVQILQTETVGQGRHGILITQLGYSSYTVAISAEVPYGLTMESRKWSMGLES